MAGTRAQRKPSFLWQAILILLPVIILASVGLFALRADKKLAEREAAERAQAIADDLLPRVWAEIGDDKNFETSRRRAFLINSSGELVFPPAAPSLPLPRPLDASALNSEQARLWSAMGRLNVNAENAAANLQLCSNFLQSNPPREFAAIGEYQFGLMLAKQQRFAEAAASFDRMLKEHPDAVGETGLPLRPLAEFQLLRLTMIGSSSRSENDKPAFVAPDLKHSISIDSFYSNIVYHPTSLTPYLMSESARWANEKWRAPEVLVMISAWQSVWRDQLLLRNLYAAAWPHRRSENGQSTLWLESDAALAARGRPASGDILLDKATFAAAGIPFARLFWFGTAEPQIPISAQTKFTFGGEAFSVVEQTEVRTVAIHSNQAGSPGFLLHEPVTAEQNWVAVRFDREATNHWFACYSENEISALLRPVTKEIRIPDIFGVEIEVAGRKLPACATDLRLWEYDTWGHGKGGGTSEKQYSKELATRALASAVHWTDGAELLKVNVYLTSPAQLYRVHSARAFWLIALVAASALAALAGLIVAWRTFGRQLQLNEMKSNFVSSVSHELRSPIASVRLMAESLERGKVLEPEKQREYFQFIGQECRRLSALIENVLDFSRIEQGRKQYELEPTDAVALVRQTVKLMDTYAAERQIRLETVLPENTVSAELDGKAMQQALVNLIDNAIKHSPKGSSIRIGLESNGQAIRFWVEDEGEGIAPEEHEKIFERFYRCGSELRRETQGVGIGLSIVKHIVEAHGGRVIVRSALGEGSRFTVEVRGAESQVQSPKSNSDKSRAGVEGEKSE